jgi:hypothetical protein
MSGEQIFTTWFTSTVDALDHAVTDEEFIAHRPEPEAVCGRVVVLGPLARPPGACCPRCTAFLHGRTSLQALDQREPHRRRRSLLARLRRFLFPPARGGGGCSSPTAVVPAVVHPERAP